MKHTPYTPDELRGLTSADSFYQLNTRSRALTHGVVGMSETVMLFADDPDLELPWTTLTQLADQLETSESLVYYADSRDAEAHLARLAPLVQPLDLVVVTGATGDVSDLDIDHLDRINQSDYVGRIGIVRSLEGAYAEVLLQCHTSDAPSLVVSIDMRLLAKIGQVETLPGAFF